MEALAAVSLAGSIFQFIDIAKGIISGTWEIYESVSGAKSEHLEAGGMAQMIQELASRVVIPEDAAISEEDKALKAIGEQCIAVSTEMLSLIQSLKVKEGHTWVESFSIALKGAWKKDEIESLNQRLDRMSHQLTSSLLPRQISKLDYRLKSMITENKRLDAKREKEILDLRKDLQTASEEIKEGLRQEGANIQATVSLTGVAEKSVQYSAEQAILGHLRFEAMDARRASVQQAHAKTFEWIFDSSSSHYVQWLQNESKLYWVSGKPGSGKSTLMKYLYTNTKTLRNLEIWAKGARLILANFFLWSPGRLPLQKSLEGLLRSIVYQVLRQVPDFVSHTFPDEWQACMSGGFTGSSLKPGSLSVPELLQAFDRISTCLSDLHVKICLFVDGLDEYQGHPDDIISLIETLKSSPNVKTCVSSRPWNEFESVFGKGGSNKLYMQDLTRNDIRTYVRDILEDSRKFQDLVDLEGEERALEFIRDIVEAAQGVFLWVILVVRSLLEGLTNADRIGDLQKRLHNLPTDLNEYFERILFTVDNFYRFHRARVFLVTLASQEALPLICYWFMDQDDADYAIKLDVSPVSPQKASFWLRVMKRRLNAYCKGLLEANFIQSGQDDSLSSSVLFHWRVDFLHRTVRDFLGTPETQKLLQESVPDDFNAGALICRSLLAQLKTIPLDRELFGINGPVSKLVSLFFRHAHSLENENLPTSTEAAILNELNSTSVRHGQRLGPDSLGKFSWISFPVDGCYILPRCVETQLRRYIAHYLQRGSPISSIEVSQLLEDILLTRPPVEYSSWSVVVVQLLEKGADPNFFHGETTLWATLLARLRRWSLDPSNRCHDHNRGMYCIVKGFLEHGADLDITCGAEQDLPSETALHLLRRLLAPQQISELLRMCKSQKKVSAKTKSPHRGAYRAGNDDTYGVSLKSWLRKMLHKDQTDIL